VSWSIFWRTHQKSADSEGGKMMKPGQWLMKVRDTRPLVHNITNVVVTNVAANTLLAIGASPVMAYAHEEVADMAKIAQALALNMGTLTPDVITAMRLAGTAANASGVPVVFDPVGVGATPYRNEAAQTIASSLQLRVLRGNAGEIGLMLGSGGEVTGVDSAGASADLPAAMKTYAKQHQTVVVATGEEDLVTDGYTLWRLTNGHPLLSAITGSGCSLTALIGAFVGVVDKDSPLETYAEAVVAAITCFNVAGERAAQVAQGPGSFQSALFDALYQLTADAVDGAAKIEQMV
jgi:hydroxyethylthiazole kinase